jgi:hypothetical protein
LFPTVYPGTTTGSAADLRSTLTEVGVGHVYLESLAGGTQAAGGDPSVAGAALRSNTLEFHNAFSSMFNDVVASNFDQLWGQQIQGYSDYAAARHAGDAAGAAAAASRLDAFTQSFGSFLAADTGGRLQAGGVAGELETQVRAVETVLDGAATGAGDLSTRIRAAAGAVPGWTTALAEAVAEQNPTRYLP